MSDEIKIEIDYMGRIDCLPENPVDNTMYYINSLKEFCIYKKDKGFTGIYKVNLDCDYDKALKDIKMRLGVFR